MCKYLKILFLLIIILVSLVKKSEAQYELWTIGTAKTMPHKLFEVGIFEPLRYGLTRKVELQTFLTAEALCPNIRTKIHWYTIPKWEILVATRHGIFYPTPGMKFIHKYKPLGIDWLDFHPNRMPVDKVRDPVYHENMLVPLEYDYLEETKIGNLVTFTNELLLSKMLIPKTSCTPPNLLLTLKLGVNFSHFFDTTHVPLINKPMIYQRSAVLHDSVLWYVGLDLDGHLNSYVDFCVDLEFLSVDWDTKDYAIEHKGLIIFPLGRFTLVAGYQVSYGTYPDGNRFFVMPLLDLTYRFGIKRLQNGLFKRDPYPRQRKEKNDKKAI